VPDVPAWLIVAGGAIGYLIALLQYRAARQSNEDTVDTAKRREILDTYRWAAELAADASELKRQLGVNALEQLASYPELTAQDKQLIVAALDVALAPVGGTSETAETMARPRSSGTPVNPVTPSQRAAAQLKLRLDADMASGERERLVTIAQSRASS
jgi:hypothetical protein